MPDPAERLVNLAFFFASRAWISADEVRRADLGYPSGQEETTFLRMFERDKDALRSAGLAIEVRKVDEVERYRLDAEGSFAHPVELAPAELAAVRAVAASLTADPGFPFGDELARALAKLGTTGHEGSLASAELADEAPVEQAEAARLLSEAVQSRKRVTFGYTNRRGERRHRTVDPYGLFFREGRWYLVGYDHDRDDTRVFALVRIHDIDMNRAAPRTPDFERPAGFSVANHALLPFEYGTQPAEATIRFSPDRAWRAERTTQGRGSLEPHADGAVLWRVPMADPHALAAWILAEGPGLIPLAPPALVDAMRSGLEEVSRRHGDA